MIIDENISEDEFNEQVLLLGIYKRKENESIKDALINVVDTGSFTLKQAKKYLKELKAKKLVQDNSLTFLGIEKAKQVEMMFRL